jgi:hypothetical protein
MSEYISQPDIVDVIRSHDTRLTDLEIGPRITWTAPKLLNGWANFGGETARAGYLRDALGFMHLRGRITGGASGKPAFTLPAGFRPGVNMIVGLLQSGAAAGAFLEIFASGGVVPFGPNVAESAFLESVPLFLAEQ